MGLAVRRYDRDAAADAGDRRAARGDLGGVAGREAARRDGLQRLAASRSRRSTACSSSCACEGDRVVAFTSWRPYRGGRAAVLDLMRKRRDAPSGTMDLLVARSLEELRAAGLAGGEPRQRAARQRGRAAGRAREGRGPALREPQRLLRLQEPVPVQEEVRAALGRAATSSTRAAARCRAVAYALTRVHGAGRLRQLIWRR